jgi:hypothetical protein
MNLITEWTNEYPVVAGLPTTRRVGEFPKKLMLLPTTLR